MSPDNVLIVGGGAREQSLGSRLQSSEKKLFKTITSSLRRRPPEALFAYEDDRIKEKCAVVGIFLPKENIASQSTYLGLFAQQHRGQEASGIISTDGTSFFTHKKEGFNYPKRRLTEKLPGNIAIGHNRYSTDGGPGHIQPVVSRVERNFVAGGEIALAHNGNLPTVKELKLFLTQREIQIDGLNDSELMQRAIEYYVVKEKKSLPEAIVASYPLFTGAFSLTVMDKNTLVGVRDNHGIRPLSLGKLPNDGYILSSETCAIDAVGGEHVRDVRAGEMVVITDKGVESMQIAFGKEQLDMFELFYFARGDSIMYGKSVHEHRKNFGRQAAKEAKIHGDVVVGVPNTSLSQAIGYSQESGIPFDMGLFKNPYVHRTFITPQKNRGEAVRMKFNPIKDVIKDKKIILVDDSLVRGTTLHYLIEEIRKWEPKSIDVIIASPPVKFPHPYGVDLPDQEHLIAANKTIDQIRESIGADSLHFLSLDGMIKSTGLPKDRFCTACFDGDYPIPIGIENEEKINFAA